jgi:hypothetical protein
MNPSTPTARKARPKSSARVCASERVFMRPPWVVAAPDSTEPGVRFAAALCLLLPRSSP